MKYIKNKYLQYKQNKLNILFKNKNKEIEQLKTEIKTLLPTHTKNNIPINYSKLYNLIQNVYNNNVEKELKSRLGENIEQQSYQIDQTTNKLKLVKWTDITQQFIKDCEKNKSNLLTNSNQNFITSSDFNPSAFPSFTGKNLQSVLKTLMPVQMSIFDYQNIGLNGTASMLAVKIVFGLFGTELKLMVKNTEQLNDKQIAEKKDKIDKILKRANELKLFTKLTNAFYEMLLVGGALLYPLFDDYDNEQVIRSGKTDLTETMDINNIKQGSLLDIIDVDPIYSTVVWSNWTMPLLPNFYLPIIWNIFGINIHHTRIYRLVDESIKIPPRMMPLFRYLGQPFIGNRCNYSIYAYEMTRQISIEFLQKRMAQVLVCDMQKMVNTETGEPSDYAKAQLQYLIDNQQNGGVSMISNGDQSTREYLEFKTWSPGKINEDIEESRNNMSMSTGLSRQNIQGNTTTGFSDGSVSVDNDQNTIKHFQPTANNLVTYFKQIIEKDLGFDIDDYIVPNFNEIHVIDPLQKSEIFKNYSDGFAKLASMNQDQTNENGITKQVSKDKVLSNEEARHLFMNNLEQAGLDISLIKNKK